MYRYGPPVRTPYRVVVDNLSSRVSWQVIIVLLYAASSLFVYCLSCYFANTIVSFSAVIIVLEIS